MEGLDLHVFLFGSSIDGKDCMQEFNPSTYEWSQVKIKDDPLWNFLPGMLAATIQDKIYFSGGYSLYDPEFFVYDPSLDAIRQLAEMPNGKIYMSVAALDGRFYSIGGVTCTLESSLQIECYNPEEESWTVPTVLSQDYYSPGVVGMDNRLYILGSCGYEEWNASCECYNPETNEWARLADFPQQITNALSVDSHEGKIYGIQRNSLAKLYVYSAINDQWETIENNGQSLPFMDGQLLWCDDHMLAVDARCAMYEFDFGIEKWDKVTDNPGDLSDMWTAVAAPATTSM